MRPSSSDTVAWASLNSAIRSFMETPRAALERPL